MPEYKKKMTRISSYLTKKMLILFILLFKRSIRLLQLIDPTQVKSPPINNGNIFQFYVHYYFIVNV